MKYITIATLTGTAMLFASAASAQQGVDFSKVEIKTTDLGNKTYMLEGQGGDITVAVGTDGIIMVDTQFAPLHDKIKAAIAAISPLPIKYVINTHYHGDHVGGNAAFHKDGATIVAHDNIRIRMAAGTINAVSGNKTPPAEQRSRLPKDLRLADRHVFLQQASFDRPVTAHEATISLLRGQK
jgi:glyoxylase-like metal-dependent hydrolase (beta-lactamase superfamily II)